MTEQDIQAVLGIHYGCGCRAIHGSMNIVVPNVLMYTANGMYEADFITITKSNYLIEIEKSCEKVGAGIIIIKQNCCWGGIAKKPKLRKVKPLTIFQQLKYAKLGCLRWPNNWNK